MISNTKRLAGEMELLKTSCSFTIPSDHFCIIEMRLSGAKWEDVNECAKSVSLWIINTRSVYCSDQKILLICSQPKLGETHYMNGKYNEIISSCVRSLTLKYPQWKPTISIISSPERIKIFSYLMYSIDESKKQKIKSLSRGEIANSDLQYKTTRELKNLLTQSCIEWQSIPVSERCGVLFKITEDKNIINLDLDSELDYLNIDKYIDMIFE